MNRSIFIVILTSLLTIQIDGYPGGAPTKVCVGSMVPRHHHLSPQPSSTSPLKKFDSRWNPDGETVSVQIKSDRPIKGIFVQGRKMNGNEPIGTFINIPSKTHIVDCPTGDGITHNSPQTWTELQLTWKKPASMRAGETIQFWATVVVDFELFWVVKSIV